MVNFTALAQTAKRLIEANARTVTLQRANTQPANAGEPWRGPGEEIVEADGGATIDVPVCFVPPAGSGLGRELRDMIGNLILDADQIGIVASDSLDGADMSTFENVIDGQKTWKIIRADELRPSTVSLLWVLYLRA